MAYHRRFGFTLLELSIVLVVLSLMVAGFLATITQEARVAQYAELQMKMDAIEQAVIAYTKRSNTRALPCPADPTLPITDPTFGIAEPFSGCPVSTLPIPNSFRRNAETTTGAVPVKSIGLPDDYAIDPWGNQFTYTVDREAATTDAFILDPISSSAIGDITVQNLAAATITTTAVMVLLSHGPNKFGGFGNGGVRKDLDSTNANEQQNCNCIQNGTASAVGLNYNSTFSIGIDTQAVGAPENNFDDIVRYYDRSFFRLYTDLVL